jgi:hypothetical protein
VCVCVCVCVCVLCRIARPCGLFACHDIFLCLFWSQVFAHSSTDHVLSAVVALELVAVVPQMDCEHGRGV